MELDLYGPVIWQVDSYLKRNDLAILLILIIYLFAFLINIRPIIEEINTGDHAAGTGEITPFTPKELNVKLKI